MFEAWRYEQVHDKLFPAFLASIYRRLSGLTGNAEQKKALDTLKSFWQSIVKSYAPALAKGAVNLWLPLSGDLVEEIGKKLKLGDMVKEFTKSQQIVDEQVEKASQEAISTDQVNKLREALERLLPLLGGGRTPVILVDDLDRCSPFGAINLLESIRLLVGNASKCQLIFAMDRTILIQAVAQKFKGLDDFESNRYLEKVFPIEFKVMPLSMEETKDWLGKHLTQNVRAEYTNNIQAVFEKCLEGGYFNNPRLLKRSINRFLLVTCQEKHTSGNVANLALIRWIMATSRWPLLRRVPLNKTYFGEIAKLQEEGKAPSAIADLHQRALLTQPGLGRWMHAVNFFGEVSAYEDSNQRLQSFGL